MATNWFPHDSAAQNDQRILLLRMKYGWEGYGLFWATLEAMYETVDAKLDAKALRALCVRFGVKEDFYTTFVKDCEEIGLFTEDEGVLFSGRLVREKEKHILKSKQAQELAERRWNNRKRKPSDAKALPRQSGGNAKGNAPTHPPHPHNPATRVRARGLEKKDETTNAQVESNSVQKQSLLTDSDTLQFFFEMAMTEGWTDETYRDAKLKQFDGLGSDDRTALLRKMRVALNANKSPGEKTKALARKIYFETVGLIQDRALDAGSIDAEALSKRRKFAQSEASVHDAQSEQEPPAWE